MSRDGSIHDNLVVLPMNHRVRSAHRAFHTAAKRHYLVLNRIVLDLFFYTHRFKSIDEALPFAHGALKKRVHDYYLQWDHEDAVDPEYALDLARVYLETLITSYKDFEIPRRETDVSIQSCRLEQQGLFINYLDYDGNEIPF